MTLHLQMNAAHAHPLGPVKELGFVVGSPIRFDCHRVIPLTAFAP